MIHLIRALRSIVAFVTGLAVTAAVVDRVAEPEVVPEFSEKLADIAGKARDSDIIFLGSSRVRRQISPKIFDAALEEAGLTMKSYNFGLDGLGFPEMLYIADEILALKPPKLKHVFLELTRFSREFGPRSQPDSQRTIYWHTPRYTAMISRAIWADPQSPPLGDRISRIGEHVEIFLRRAGNVGRGVDILGIAGKRPAFQKMGPNGDGFFPVHQQFPASRRAEYARQVSALPGVLREPPVVEPIFLEATRDLLKKFQEAGVTPIFVTMPRIHPVSPWVPAPDDSAGAPVLAFRFDDPEKHPDLFAVGAHYDAQHLNADGAKVFSRKLAERFVTHVKAQPGAGGPAF